MCRAELRNKSLASRPEVYLEPEPVIEAATQPDVCFFCVCVNFAFILSSDRVFCVCQTFFNKVTAIKKTELISLQVQFFLNG